MAKSDLLLFMLSTCNGSPIRGKTRLVKLMYIAGSRLKKEHKHVDFYKFDKYYYGPYCNELSNDLEILVAQKLINHEIIQHQTTCGIYEENVYQITKKGITEAEKKKSLSNSTIVRIIEEVKTKYNNMSLSMLIQEVYKKYPLLS